MNHPAYLPIETLQCRSHAALVGRALSSLISVKLRASVCMARSAPLLLILRALIAIGLG